MLRLAIPVTVLILAYALFFGYTAATYAQLPAKVASHFDIHGNPNGWMSRAEDAEILTAVFARKPWPEPRSLEPDFVAWEAPARYLVGYGMDAAGAQRGLPYIGAVD